MPRQLNTTPTVAPAETSKPRAHPNPNSDSYTQFLPSDRATQILLQQFL